MASNRFINARLYVAGAAAGLGSWGLNLYGSIRANQAHHKLDDIADTLQNLNATLADQVRSVGNDAYNTSRVEGIAGDVLFILPTLPSFWQSLSIRAQGSMATLRFYTENWDYLAGRALQGTGVGLMAYGLRQDGAHNPQIATAYTAAGAATTTLGTMFVARNANRTGGVAGPAVDAPDLYQPLAPNASSSSSASAPQRDIEGGSYSPRTPGGSRR